MAKFSFKIEKEQDSDKLNLKGELDEDYVLDPNEIGNQVSNKCIINFKEVESINSCGVRTWINFLREFETNRDIIFQECSPEIVDQIDMIPSFKGSAVVESAYANMACSNCSFEKKFLFTKEQIEQDSEALSKVTCEKCGSDMEIETFEDDFIGIFE